MDPKVITKMASHQQDQQEAHNFRKAASVWDWENNMVNIIEQRPAIPNLGTYFSGPQLV